MKFFQPDRYFSRISKIDIDKDILQKGYKYLLLDVDNTILTRDWSIVPKDVKQWISDAITAGVQICLISNDWHKNVVELAQQLVLPLVAKSLKPLPIAFLRAMKKIKASRKNTLMIGDQLMTDVFGAHMAGVDCILLKPLVKTDLVHTLALRKIENIFMRVKQPER